MITKTTVLDHSKQLLDRCLDTLQQAQAEYASGSDNGLQNFERIGAELGLPREVILMVFARKHWDGVIAYVNGHKSQREGVEGRIRDLIVYLCLLSAMVMEDGESTITREELRKLSSDKQKELIVEKGFVVA